jgi:tRNA(Arg) A34 adenosine deaminase TadA
VPGLARSWGRMTAGQADAMSRKQAACSHRAGCSIIFCAKAPSTPATPRNSMLRTTLSLRRRRVIARALSLLALSAAVPWTRSQPVSDASPNPRWAEAARAMKKLAESWGDQPYGAVLVIDDHLVGEGPSRVVQRADATAHAEREAIRDAQRRLRRVSLAGSVLYSTSRPCAACEAAAAAAGVSRMYFGEAMQDGGAPKP